VDERTLKVGPYQGGHGCLTIDVDRGVCGASVREKSIMMIRDVSTVDNHIVCDSETKSEMVLPVVGTSGTVLAVFDVDSTEFGAFDQTDKEYLSKLVDWIRPLYDRYPGRFVDENQAGGGTNFSI
jgi:GAF domain-containing protein